MHAVGGMEGTEGGNSLRLRRSARSLVQYIRERSVADQMKKETGKAAGGDAKRSYEKKRS